MLTGHSRWLNGPSSPPAQPEGKDISRRAAITKPTEPSATPPTRAKPASKPGTPKPSRLGTPAHRRSRGNRDLGGNVEVWLFNVVVVWYVKATLRLRRKRRGASAVTSPTTHSFHGTLLESSSLLPICHVSFSKNRFPMRRSWKASVS